MPEIKNTIPAVQAAPPEHTPLTFASSSSSGLPAASSAEPRERYPNRFKPGQSGNPSGRPKKTDEEKEVLEQIKALGPKAVEAAKKILESDRVAAVAKVQVISLVLAYAIGRPESNIKLSAAPAQSIEATEARVEALIRSIRIENGAPEEAPLAGEAQTP